MDRTAAPPAETNKHSNHEETTGGSNVHAATFKVSNQKPIGIGGWRMETFIYSNSSTVMEAPLFFGMYQILKIPWVLYTCMILIWMDNTYSSFHEFKTMMTFDKERPIETYWKSGVFSWKIPEQLPALPLRLLGGCALIQ